MQFENTFKQIDQILWKEQGCGSELDYLEQKSWLLFLKYLDDLETEREDEAELEGKTYKRLVTGYYRWSQWAAPKVRAKEHCSSEQNKAKEPSSSEQNGKSGNTGLNEAPKMVLDTVNAMSGDDLVEFVDGKLFPYLKGFQQSASSTDSLEYKIGEIFGELHNKIRSGFNMREIINMVDELHFQSADDKHEMTVLYESNIQRMGNAGRNGGEYYTPRPLIRSIIKVVDPKIGETVYDPACGSAGFLCEAYLYMKDKIKGTKDYDTLQKNTFYGTEKKGLPYIIATMNMIFHGVSAPNITHGNTLARNVMTIQESDRKNVILANPPFGGNERGEVLQNFEIRTSETAYMFMQHFIKMLKAGGRAGIVIKNTFLSNGDAAAVRKMLLESCNLHTILDLPSGVFTGAGVKTVVLFFTKGQPTEKIWYYQVDKHFTKTQPLTEADMAEFISLQKTKADSEHSWSISADSLGEDCDLSVKNPNKVEVTDDRTPEEILTKMRNLTNDSLQILYSLLDAETKFKLALKEMMQPKEGWELEKVGKLFKTYAGGTPLKSSKEYYEGGNIPWLRSGEVCRKYITETEMFITQAGLDNSSAKFYPIDTVVIAMYGATAAQVGILKLETTSNQAVCGILPNSDYIPEFVYYWFRYRQDFLAAQAQGGAQPNISQIKIKNITIPVIDKDTQHSIVATLDALSEKVSALEANYTKTIRECGALKQALLKQVFE